MEIFFTGIILLVFGGVSSLFFSENKKLKVVSIFSVLSSILIIYSAFTTKQDANFFLLPFNNISFAIDKLSAFFITVISLITSLSSVYSIGYMKPYEGKNKKFASHCVFFPLLTASMLMVVTVQNAFFFLILWELMSLSSFFLVIFEDDKKEVLSAGIKYLIYMHISVIFIIAAFALMSANALSYDFSSFNQIFENNPYLKDIVFTLSLIGFGTKAGFFPMHNWLPDAHPAAPSHVSAVMSAVMIKTGIYGIIRVLLFISKPTLFMAYLLLAISVITALYAVIYAVNQKDIKKMLAYSSAENIGIIGIALSTLMFGVIFSNETIILLATIGCFLHILNHSVFKSLLFMSAGSIYAKTHTKNMENLGGLVKKMPYTAVFFLFGCVAICALPPLNGFVSEFLIYIGLFNLLKSYSSAMFICAIFAIASLAFVGTLVMLAVSKMYSISFLGLPRSEYSENVNSDVPKSMLIPMGILSSLTIILGIGSIFVIPFIPLPNINLIFNVQLLLFAVSIFAFTLIVFVLFLLVIRRILNKGCVKHETWGCGYEKPNNHMQYTGSSFSAPFVSILTPVFKKKFDVKKPKGFFPQDAHYTAQVEDVEEAYIINPVIKMDEKFLSKFERIQDGDIRHYILWGLIFLILMLIGVVFLG